MIEKIELTDEEKSLYDNSKKVTYTLRNRSRVKLEKVNIYI
jgi:hypothetical protein